jgi:hypothetical protein
MVTECALSACAVALLLFAHSTQEFDSDSLQAMTDYPSLIDQSTANLTTGTLKSSTKSRLAACQPGNACEQCNRECAGTCMRRPSRSNRNLRRSTGSRFQAKMKSRTTTKTGPRCCTILIWVFHQLLGFVRRLSGESLEPVKHVRSSAPDNLPIARRFEVRCALAERQLICACSNAGHAGPYCAGQDHLAATREQVCDHVWRS